MSIILYCLNAIVFILVSWTFGLLLNNAIKNRKFYSKLSHFYFIKNDALTKILGLNKFGWLIRNSFFRVFNQKLKLKKRATRENLQRIRDEMVYAEIGHVIGFVFILVIILIKIWNGQYAFAMILFIFNIIFNLYPSLLQQHNKKRIDRILKQ